GADGVDGCDLHGLAGVFLAIGEGKSAAGAELDHGLAGAELDDSPGELRRRFRLAHGDRRLVIAGEHDVGLGDDAAVALARLLTRPELAAKVQVEGDGDARLLRHADRLGNGRGHALGEGGGDAGEVQHLGPADQVGVEVRGEQPPSGVALPVVPDMGVARRAPLLDHERGRRLGVAHTDGPDALSREFPQHEVTEGVGSDPADPGDFDAETAQADRHVALRTADAEFHGASVLQRPRARRGHEGHRLAQRDHTARDNIAGDDAAHARASRATSTAALARAASSVSDPPLSASPTSGPPRLTATAPAFSQSGMCSRAMPPDGTNCSSGNGPRRCEPYCGPTVSAGKIFTAVAPACHAVNSSVGVSPPGNTGTPAATATSMTATFRMGVTR